MSSFKDTFTKEDAKSNVLEYDDSAFYYFATTVLVLFLAPVSFKFVRNYLLGRRRSATAARKKLINKKSQFCGCSACAKWFLEDDENASVSIWTRLGSWQAITQLVLIILGWILVIILFFSLGSMGGISNFNPYEILNIGVDATEKQIKKAYRLMSLRYHPDKNKNDASAAARFILIAKAYNALTDEVSKKNFEKYGNPDGAGLMKVGIGMPKILLAEGAQVFFLAVFFTILLVVIPMAFIIYYNHTRSYTASGVKVETVQLVAGYMTEQTRTFQTLKFIAASGEARDLPSRPTDDAALAVVSTELSKAKVKEDCNFKDVSVKKAELLLLAHLNRLHFSLSEDLRDDLRSLLLSSSLITKTMLEVAFVSNWFFTVYAVLDLRRCVIQGISFGQNELLQLPHATHEICRILAKGGVKKLSHLVNDIVSVDSKINGAFTDQTKIEDVKCFLRCLPRLSIIGKIEVEDEKEIAVGDVASLCLHITRENLRKDEKQGSVHAPFFPEMKNDEWWVFASVSHTGQLIGYTTYKSADRVAEVEIQFPVSRPGKNAVIVTAICDSYIGLDCVQTYHYTALREDEVKREIIVHPDDLALDQQPTLIQQMIGGLDDGESEAEDIDQGTDTDDNSVDEIKDENRKSGEVENKKKDENYELEVEY